MASRTFQDLPSWVLDFSADCDPGQIESAFPLPWNPSKNRGSFHVWFKPNDILEIRGSYIRKFEAVLLNSTFWRGRDGQNASVIPATSLNNFGNSKHPNNWTSYKFHPDSTCRRLRWFQKPSTTCGWASTRGFLSRHITTKSARSLLARSFTQYLQRPTPSTIKLRRSSKNDCTKRTLRPTKHNTRRCARRRHDNAIPRGWLGN